MRVSKTTISIAVDGVNDSTLDWQNVVLYNIVKLANDVTYRRIKMFVSHSQWNCVSSAYSHRTTVSFLGVVAE